MTEANDDIGKRNDVFLAGLFCLDFYFLFYRFPCKVVTMELKPAVAVGAQTVKHPGLRSLKSCATELT